MDAVTGKSRAECQWVAARGARRSKLELGPVAQMPARRADRRLVVRGADPERVAALERVAAERAASERVAAEWVAAEWVVERELLEAEALGSTVEETPILEAGRLASTQVAAEPAARGGPAGARVSSMPDPPPACQASSAAAEPSIAPMRSGIWAMVIPINVGRTELGPGA
jgi:hypothetical protein